MVRIEKIKTESGFTDGLNREKFVDFLFTHLGQFGDSKEAINACLDYAFGYDGKAGGFLVSAWENDRLVGELVINNTGMKGYIPEHILVYVAVDQEFRGKGIGKKLVEYALSECPGDVKLHVEYENPAKRLYERIGFTSKYAEMRFVK